MLLFLDAVKDMNVNDGSLILLVPGLRRKRRPVAKVVFGAIFDGLPGAVGWRPTVPHGYELRLRSL